MSNRSITDEQYKEISDSMYRKGVPHNSFELLADLRASEQQLRKDVEFLKSFIPVWARTEPLSGIDATFYGTGSFTGDLEVFERVFKIINE